VSGLEPVESLTSGQLNVILCDRHHEFHRRVGLERVVNQARLYCPQESLSMTFVNPRKDDFHNK
jgi:hypothetical protein